MAAHTIDALAARYDRLLSDKGFDEWRQLSQDVLTALVEHQGLVIALQRRALESQRSEQADREALRVRAEAAFAMVQALHQIRRKVHALVAERRNARVLSFARVA